MEVVKLLLLLSVSVVNVVHCFVNFADVPCGGGGRAARVIGGGSARQGEFPWMASLTRRGGHYCGATVLSSHWLITAAHCMCSGTNELLRPNYIRVTLGEHDLTRPEEPAASEERVEQIVMHPGYQCGRAKDDLALIKLVQPARWSDSVAPACLPESRPSAAYRDFSGTPATVAGWGWLAEDTSKGGRADVLQKVEVNVLENTRCQEWYSSQGKKTKINPSQMCAGEEQGGRDSCWADSGGPLMASQGSNAVVIGVVSTGIGCGRPRLPGLYTRVSEYMDWIQQHVK